jgi:hypothetical protein
MEMKNEKRKDKARQKASQRNWKGKPKEIDP